MIAVLCASKHEPLEILFSFITNTMITTMTDGFLAVLTADCNGWVCVVVKCMLSALCFSVPFKVISWMLI